MTYVTAKSGKEVSRANIYEEERGCSFGIYRRWEFEGVWSVDPCGLFDYVF